MMLTRIIYYFMLFLPFAIVGCSGVTSEHLVGRTPLVLETDDWNGTWMDAENNVIFLNVRDAEIGIIEMAGVDDEDGQFQLHIMTCQLMEGNNWVFGNVLSTDDEDLQGTYLWGRVEKNEHEIIIWSPSAKAFRKAVEEGQLKGHVEKSLPENNGEETRAIPSGSVVQLQESSERLVEFIESSQHFPLFDWEEPIILRKLGQ